MIINEDVLTKVEEGDIDNNSLVIIPESVRVIDANVFDSYNNIKQVRLPAKLECINKFAFFHCDNLELITYVNTKGNIVKGFPKSLYFIGEKAFSFCSKLENDLDLTNVKSLGEGAFQFCNSVKKVSLNIESVSENAFAQCTGLKSVNFKNNTRFIKDCAFSGCLNLQDVKFNEGLRAIYPYAFIFCSKISDIDIPASVELIDDGAFRHCNLSNVTFNKDVKTVNPSAFYGCKDTVFTNNNNTALNINELSK